MHKPCVIVSQEGVQNKPVLIAPTWENTNPMGIPVTIGDQCEAWVSTSVLL